MSQTVIKVENLGKLYRLGEVGTGTISHDLNRWWARVRGKEDPFAKIGQVNDRTTKGSSDYVWALKDVNFEVKQGEVLGIIGCNGAGKSTLLKILSKVSAPTTGSIKVKGRIASLLEVGTGFHPELTGRENIYLNGAILGMTRSEIRSKFDEIVDFAGVERYIDTPVKRYSSGMYVRLAFAVAAFLEPEILIVDEVLAVGDAEFQKKCLGRMKDVSVNEGRTVLFVSHNMGAVQELCTSALLLNQGGVVCTANVPEVVAAYINNNSKQMIWQGADGDAEVKLLSAGVCAWDGGQEIRVGDSIRLQLSVQLLKPFPDLVIGVNVYSAFNQPLVRLNYNDFENYGALREGTYKVCFKIPADTLATGSYRVSFDIAVHCVKKYTSAISELHFDVLPVGQRGNKYLIEGSAIHNSLVRPNWFYSIVKL